MQELSSLVHFSYNSFSILRREGTKNGSTVLKVNSDLERVVSLLLSQKVSSPFGNPFSVASVYCSNKINGSTTLLSDSNN